MLSHPSPRQPRSRLAEAMTAGVYVEALDDTGLILGQAVFTAWQGRPLPEVGETLVCPLNSPEHGRRKVAGEVQSRRFEIQCDESGAPEVWVSMTIVVDEPAVGSRGGRNRLPRN